MFKNFINSLFSFITFPTNKLEMKTKELAMQVNQHFDNLLKTLKSGEPIMADYQNKVNEREQFLIDNEGILKGRNLETETDNKRAFSMRIGAMIIGCLLSVKGLKFLFEELFATVSMLFIIPFAIAFAAMIVGLSINMSNSAEKYRNSNKVSFYQLKIVAYALVLFIPILNLIEGFDSNYRPSVMALNTLICVIDFNLHASLISMYKQFTFVDDYNQAMKILHLKDKDVSIANQKLRAFNEVLQNSKNNFTNIAKQFVYSYNALQNTDNKAKAAENITYLLDNFTIWMINNKVIQHAILQYHADENGHPILEMQYFSPEQDSYRLEWDKMSRINMGNSDNQPQQAINNGSQAQDILVDNETLQNTNHNDAQYPQNQENEQAYNTPESYDAILDNVNFNDKTL